MILHEEMVSLHNIIDDMYEAGITIAENGHCDPKAMMSLYCSFDEQYDRIMRILRAKGVLAK